MKTHKREISLLYNPESSSDRKTVAHAQGVIPFVKSYEFSKSGNTSTTWRMILDAIGKHPKELMNKAHPDYQANIRGKEFDEEGWINVITRNTHLIKAPIAIKGNKAIMCENPTDIYRL